MPGYLRAAALAVVSALASGCSLFNVIFFNSAEASFHRKDSETTLEFYEATYGDSCEQAYFTIQEKKKKAKEAEDFGFAPPLIPLIVGGSQIVMNLAATEIKGYLEKKKAEFSVSYNASLNVEYAYPKDKQYLFSPYNCLLMRRTLPDNQANQKVVAFEWFARLLRNVSGTAQRISTEKINLSRAAARTDQASRKIDVVVEVKIDVIVPDKTGEVVEKVLADKRLAYHGLTLPPDLTTPAKADNTGQESSWFAAIPQSKEEIAACNANLCCRGISPVSITVVVTEIGSGADSFGNLGKEVDDNRSTLSDAISNAINEALRPE